MTNPRHLSFRSVAPKLRSAGVGVALLAVVSPMPAAEPAPQFVFIGTNGAGPGTGIARATFNAETGTLTKPELVAVTSDPAFLALDPDGRYLYAANTGTPGGVSAFAIEPATGDLTFLNDRSSPARGPSHVSVDRTGRFVFDANYGGGHIRAHALNADGSLGAQTAFIQHEGHSVHPQRQTKPYAHCIRIDPGNRFALVADLGLDQILAYRFDAATGALTPNDPPFAQLAPGAGPRHLTWHPNERFVYVVNELANTVTAFAWDGVRGALTALQTVATLPEDFTGNSTSAEIGVHPNGRFLYTSNRGHDSIARFAVDPVTGQLTPLGQVSSNGRTPRYFVFDLTSRWMIVTHHDSDTIVVFAVDPETGALTSHGDPVLWVKPYGIVLLPAS